MSASRFLSASRQLLTKNAFPLRKSVGESAARECHVMCVPPRNRVSLSETVVYGIILAASMWVIPAWVMYHIPDYQKEDRNVYSGK